MCVEWEGSAATSQAPITVHVEQDMRKRQKRMDRLLARVNTNMIILVSLHINYSPNHDYFHLGYIQYYFSEVPAVQ